MLKEKTNCYEADFIEGQSNIRDSYQNQVAVALIRGDARKQISAQYTV